MAEYAVNDTRYLKPLSDHLRAELMKKGRLDWHRETCLRLVYDCAQPRTLDPDEVWRLKGSDRLDRRGLAILHELWHWREQEAIAANRPPYFVVAHETLVMLANSGARSGDLSSLPIFRGSSHRREGMLAAIERALALPAAQWPARRRSSGRPPTEAEKRRTHELRQRRDQQAGRLGIDPTLIASRATLVALASDWSQARDRLMGWQIALLEEDARTSSTS
jgi:ribonuclease D